MRYDFRQGLHITLLTLLQPNVVCNITFYFHLSCVRFLVIELITVHAGIRVAQLSSIHRVVKGAETTMTGVRQVNINMQVI